MLGIFIFLSLFFSANGQMSAISDTLLKSKLIDTLLSVPQQPWKTAGLLLATNIGVWSFDRFILNAPYSRINLNTIQRNFKSGLVWDNDMFATNLYAHPYHGGLYFNTARNHGMDFWKSIPATAAGSFMWEFCMENEPPAINDLFSTIFGGASLGEMTFRISDLLIDNRIVGFNRFKREILLTLISPIKGLNRWMNGSAWKHSKMRGNVLPTIPINLYSTIGYRILVDKSLLVNRESNAVCFDVGINYGDAFSEENEKPYDYFSLQLGGNAYPNQPIISHINALGLLYTKKYGLEKIKSELIGGIFQHFNFYQAYSDIENVAFNSYQIAEAASIGTGLLIKTQLTENVHITSSFHLNAILLGGSQTDYYKYENRDYNMGSGFSSKLNVDIKIGQKAKISVYYGDYRIYSWIGLENNGNAAISSNVQGDKGNARLMVASLNLSYSIGKNILLQAESNFYHRKSTYYYYPPVKQNVTENKIGIGFVF